MSEDFQADLVNDFLDEFHDAQNDIRKSLITLDNNPADSEAARALFRNVHTIKSNLRMIGLPLLSELMHRMEDLLDDVRHERLPYTQPLSDLLLLSMEGIYRLCIDRFANKEIRAEVEKYSSALQALLASDRSESQIVQAITIFDPYHQADEPHALDDENLDDDVALFETLSIAMENRLLGKKGSTERVLEIALAMNEIANKPVKPNQLKTAVMMHDAAMAFLPLSLLNKKEKYTELERKKLHAHPVQAAEILRNLKSWQEAAVIVEQHHERIDGQGYPNGLAGENICAGAKILAIADTYESMSQQRADREHRRTIIRIVAEINGLKGKQFDEFWVDIFNSCIRQVVLNKRNSQ